MAAEDILILSDRDVMALAPMKAAVQVMNQTIISRSHGDLVSPPREMFSMDSTGLVWTPGGHRQLKAMGLRLYPTGVPKGDQAVLLWDSVKGSLKAISIGSYLGLLRTGAIGGVAIDAMSRKDSRVVGVVGFGEQAWMQVQACIAVRSIDRVQVYRRSRSLLARMAREASREFGVEVTPVDDARTAVANADIVITATDSPTPVVYGPWIDPGTHVNALGPKYTGRSEIEDGLYSKASLIASDFPEQYLRDSSFAFRSHPATGGMRDLASIIEDQVPRKDDEITLFLSHGLSGSEVCLLDFVHGRAVSTGYRAAARVHTD